MTRLFLLALLIPFIGFSQQVPDSTFHPPITNPLYQPGKGPVVLVDEGHSNFHTTSGRFRPFAEFLRQDGYTVKGSLGKITPDVLRSVKILVISNALHESNIGRWELPTPSAFSDEEINFIQQWVAEGGSLFLIADHMPFPGAVGKLAASFGFEMFNGFARKKPDNGEDIFILTEGLIEGPLTQGRTVSERITALQTFTGQAFRCPSGATPVVVLDKRFTLLLPRVAWQFDRDTETRSADGLVQGAHMEWGKGRLVIFGEAAMFSAQIQQGKKKMGMNAPTAKQNPQFLLNVIHWLDHAY